MKTGDVFCIQMKRGSELAGKSAGGDLWGEIVELDGFLKFKVWNPAPAHLRGQFLDIKINGISPVPVDYYSK